MKVVVTFPVAEAAKAQLNSMFDCRFWESEVPIPAHTLATWLSDAEGVLTTLTCPLNHEALVDAKRLSLIHI